MIPLAAIDPGRSKCGLVLADPEQGQVLAAGVLPPQRCQMQLETWLAQGSCSAVVLGNGTGSRAWQAWIQERLPLVLVPEAGTTLEARRRYWQLEPPRGWRRLLPPGLRLPPRDVDDVVAQILLERHLGRALTRGADLALLPR
ncbi:MAG: resolvase [Cyanobacteria bacterium M_surface_10_m2_179]|nr:resolvase [Cyanobacteria bacterium M_surface_10_m2_179]